MGNERSESESESDSEREREREKEREGWIDMELAEETKKGNQADTATGRSLGWAWRGSICMHFAFVYATTYSRIHPCLWLEFSRSISRRVRPHSTDPQALLTHLSSFSHPLPCSVSHFLVSFHSFVRSAHSLCSYIYPAFILILFLFLFLFFFIQLFFSLTLIHFSCVSGTLKDYRERPEKFLHKNVRIW